MAGPPRYTLAGEFAASQQRTSAYLTHENFHKYHTETEMLRYIHHLQNKDLGLQTAMIPLGSCTMKLNATASQPKAQLHARTHALPHSRTRALSTRNPKPSQPCAPTRYSRRTMYHVCPAWA